jgi:hypothetical protein
LIISILDLLGALATVDDHAPLDQAAKLLGLKGQSDHLEATLTVRAIRGPDGIINRELTHVEAESTKDALSKALFQVCFFDVCLWFWFGFFSLFLTHHTYSPSLFLPSSLSSFLRAHTHTHTHASDSVSFRT